MEKAVKYLKVFALMMSTFFVGNYAHATECPANVPVKFVDKGWVLKEVPDPNAIFPDSKPKRVGAFTRNSRLRVKTKDSGACVKEVVVTWEEPILVVMPMKERVGACSYNILFAHEMEHVRVFLEVPKSFEKEISHAASSKNLNRDLLNTLSKINKEMIRRGEHFHKFEGTVPLHRCRSTSMWGKW